MTRTNAKKSWMSPMAALAIMVALAPSEALADCHITTGSDASVPPAKMVLGNSGPCVRLLQNRLKESGAVLTPTGEFDDKTHAAVEAFQRGNGLKVDGVAGPATQHALGLRK